MSEKRPVFIQIMSPKLEDTVAVLEAVNGKERSWAEFAKESGSTHLLCRVSLTASRKTR